MAKQIRGLKGFFSITTGLVSLSYLMAPVYAGNIGVISETDSENHNVIDKLQETVTNYNEHSSMVFDLKLNLDENQENIFANNNPELSNYVDLGLPEVLSITATDYLNVITKKPQESTEDFQAIEIGTIDNNNRPELSPTNLFAYLVNSFQQIKTDQPINFEKPANIAILPQIESKKIYNDMYEFDSNIAPKEYTLDSPLSSVFNDQSSNNSNSANNNQNSPSDILTSRNINRNVYAGLQQQLISSVNVIQTPSQQYAGTTPAPEPVNTGVPSMPTTYINRSNWFQYFSIGQQYSNPAGLINTSSSSYVSSQLQLQEQTEQEIRQRMPMFIKSNQKVF